MRYFIVASIAAVSQAIKTSSAQNQLSAFDQDFLYNLAYEIALETDPSRNMPLEWQEKYQSVLTSHMVEIIQEITMDWELPAMCD